MKKYDFSKKNKLDFTTGNNGIWFWELNKELVHNCLWFDAVRINFSVGSSNLYKILISLMPKIMAFW